MSTIYYNFSISASLTYTFSDRQSFAQTAQISTVYEGILLYYLFYRLFSVLFQQYYLHYSKCFLIRMASKLYKTCSFRNAAMAMKCFSKMVELHDLLSLLSCSVVKVAEAQYHIILLRLDLFSTSCTCFVSQPSTETDQGVLSAVSIERSTSIYCRNAYSPIFHSSF